MSSTILYKFRSGTTFEALPLPGSAARLLDVKKAIVTAKKLDQGSMDFDLSVKDAGTGTEYTDDAAILPRGTRIIVQRLPAARGQGILAKIARAQYGGSAPQAHHHTNHHSVPSDFYTIDSTAHDDEDEFVSSSNAAHQSSNAEENELAALRAATDTVAVTGSAGLGRGGSSRMPAGNYRSSHPQPGGGGPPPSQQHRAHFQPNRTRPNADPELREQEVQPKKRATGIPRTFLNLSAPPKTDGTGDGGNVPLLQPNAIGFEELVNRGGGQSENVAGTKRDLDYAIKLTSTTVPEYLQCAICHGVVRDAMMLPWDTEGRTTCEQCIRNALSESGFRCPLTQQEGVSPDDLLPNHALRKAADQFIKEVMERVEEIDKQAAVEEKITGEDEAKAKILDGGSGDQGVVLTRRASAAEKRKKEEEDPFGGGNDDFGGDVFAVEGANTNEEKVEEEAEEAESGTNGMVEKEDVKKEETLAIKSEAKESNEEVKDEAKNVTESLPGPNERVPVKTEQSTTNEEPKVDKVSNENNKRDTGSRRRGPPVGYSMGPAGGAVDEDPSPRGHKDYSPRGGDNRADPRQKSHEERSYRGGRGQRGGRSYGGRFSGGPSRGGRYQDDHRRDDQQQRHEAADSRGTKRSRSPNPGDARSDEQSRYGNSDHRGGGSGHGGGRPRGGSGYRGGGQGGYRGRGGGGPPRGRGGFRQGRGRH